MPETATHCLCSQAQVQWGPSGVEGRGMPRGHVSFHFKIWFLILVQKECGLELGGCESSSPRLLVRLVSPTDNHHWQSCMAKAVQSLSLGAVWFTAPVKNTEHLLLSQTSQWWQGGLKARRWQFPLQPRQSSLERLDPLYFQQMGQ